MNKTRIRLPSAFIALFFLLNSILLLLSPVFAQSPELFRPDASLSPAATIKSKQTYEDVTLGKDYFLGYAYDLQHIVTSPARWESRDWIIAFSVLGLAGGVYFLDGRINDWVQGHKNGFSNRVAEIGNALGNGFYTVPALGLFYAYGASADDSRAKRTFLLGAESFVISGLISTGIKYTTHRSRPADGRDPADWDGPSAKSTDLSFCSGHSTAAFSIATVIATQYADKPWVPYVSYGLAALTPYARMHDGAHWASDVLVGSALGYFTAKAVMVLHEKKSKIQITPATAGQGLAFAVPF